MGTQLLLVTYASIILIVVLAGLLAFLICIVVKVSQIAKTTKEIRNAVYKMQDKQYKDDLKDVLKELQK